MPAHRVPLVLLCQETGISPPHPLRSTTRTPPPPSSHRPIPVPGRQGTGRGHRNATAAPRRAPTGPCAPGPRPRPQRCGRPRSRSRRCPRRRRPTLSSLWKLQAHVSPGAGRGRQWGGGGGERHGDPWTFAQSGPRDSSMGIVPGRPCLLSRTMGPPGDPAPLRFQENLGQREERQSIGGGNSTGNNGVGSSGARSGTRLGMTRRPDLEAKPPGEEELCNTPFQSLAF